METTIAAGDQTLENGSPYRSFHAVRFGEQDLEALPWGEERFDCVLVVLDETLEEDRVDRIVQQVAASRIDWLETTGPGAGPVRRRFGDGPRPKDASSSDSPTSVWAEDAVTAADAARVAVCTLGGQPQVLCWVVGSEERYAAFVAELRSRLAP